jgi:iron complex outermembrane receptor protein
METRLLILPVADAVAAAEAPPPATPPIIVTGQRPVPSSPATVESADARRIDETVSVVTTEDVLRYLPSLLARRRHAGDTQAPLATRTSGVGASARSLVYADGVLLSALIGNNNSNASPRWNMVSPEEVARVDVLYGPFAAGYPGNSIGAVVNLTTRMPERLEATVRAGVSVQRFGQYGTEGTYPAYHESFSIGGRSGRLAWMVSGNRLDSRGQPLAYATVARPAAAGGGGVPATGAYPDLNRAGAPIYVLGAAGLEAQAQETLRLKLAFEVAPGLRLTYRGGLFVNDTEARAESYLSGPGGAVYAGNVSIDGRAVAIPASAFSSNVYTLAERHWMHALGLEGGGGGLQWRLTGSLYDYAKDAQRLPSGALPAAAAGGAGSILRMDGTGWRTLDASAGWRPDAAGAHAAGFGAHWDRFRLESRRFATADWRAGGEGALTQAARGETETAALWAEDRWTLAPRLQLTLGGRYEWWRARRGFNFSLAPALSVAQPERTQQGFSPKASLRWTPAASWSVTLSGGQAYRFPTVGELYQAIATGPTITVPDPDLRAERARSEELAIAYQPGKARFRLSLFNEAIRDALVAQSAPLAAGSTTLFTFVQNVRAVRTRGIEAALDWNDLLVRGLELQASVTLADPKTLSDPAFAAAEGKDIPQVPRRRATLVLTYHPDARSAVTLAGRYASRSFATVDNSDPVSFTYQGFGRYLVLDARATLRVGPHLELGVGVDNLTDDRYFLFHPFPGRSAAVDATFRW